MLSLAEKIVAEMEVRYAKDGLKVSDVIELSDDDGDDEVSDDGYMPYCWDDEPTPDLSDDGFWDDRAD